MKQYKDLINNITIDGDLKGEARDNMPITTSLFGCQMKFDLITDGFPLLTGKMMKFENIVTELLWFIRGDSNIKYLIDNGFPYWNEDAYNYYCKYACANDVEVNAILMHIDDETGLRFWDPNAKTSYLSMMKFEEFVEVVTKTPRNELPKYKDYTLGDTGYQYPKVWRDFNGVDQLYNLVWGLVKNPYGRRHIITSIDPAHVDKVALYWCHSLVQFNCRPISLGYRVEMWETFNGKKMADKTPSEILDICDEAMVPKYFLDCQMYQRSGDMFLGVPYNIASYALLTHLLCHMVNMLPGIYTHTLGDAHIYSDHWPSIQKYMAQPVHQCPFVTVHPPLELVDTSLDITDKGSFNHIINSLDKDIFKLHEYIHGPYIPAKLHTGMIK